MHTFMAFVVFISYVSAELSSGTGIVGQGRVLFKPECCFACLSSLWSLSLPCSQGDVNSTLSINSPACHASTVPYLQSLAWCLQDYCPSDGVGQDKIESFWPGSAGDGMQVRSWQSYLTARPATTLPLNATSLTEAGLVSSTKYQYSKETLKSYARQEGYHSLYSTIIISASLGFALLIGVYSRLDALALRFFHRPIITFAFLKKYLLDPATFRKRTAQMLPFRLGYVPQRRTTLLIVIFLAVNVAFNFLNFPVYGNDTWFVSASTLFDSNLANRLGVLSVVNIAMAIIFSGRDSFVMYITGCSRSTVIAIHRWTGRIAVVKAIAHSVIYLSTSSKYGMETFTPAAALKYIGCNGSYWEFGIASYLLLIIILISSIAPIRAYWYEAFLVSHVALAVGALIALWYHLRNRFHGQYGYEVWLYLAFAFWGFDRAFRLVRLAVLNFERLTGKSPPATMELLADGNLIKVTLHTSNSRLNKPGQYCFVYFPTLTWFLESHPFSIISSSSRVVNGVEREKRKPIMDDAENQISHHSDKEATGITGNPSASHATNLSKAQFEISFLIRPGGGITKKLRERLARAGSSLSLPILIEGPYGSSTTKVFASESILAFAGGVGITGVLGHLNHHIAMQRASRSPASGQGLFRVRKFSLFWTVKSRLELEALQPFLPDEATAQDAGIELQIVCTERGDQRLEWRDEIAKEKRAMDKSHSLCVLVCGPPVMADEIRRAVVKEHGSTGARIELVPEVFAW